MYTTSTADDLDALARQFEADALLAATAKVLCVFVYEAPDGTFPYNIGMSSRSFEGYNRLAPDDIDTTDLTGAQPWAVAYWWNEVVVVGKGDNERLRTKLEQRFHAVINGEERTGEL